MATASSEPLPSGEEGDEDAEVTVDDELRNASDQALEEKAQRIQNNLPSLRLPDGGKKYLRSLEAVRRELARRQNARSALASPQPRPPRPQGRHGEPDVNRCERIIQSRCAESSGLSSDSNENHAVTKSVFLSAFKADDEAGIDLSCQGISTTCPHKPKTSVENEGKLYEVDESCETDAQPTYLSPKASRMENSIDLENLSPDNAYLSPKASRMDNSIDLENLSPDNAYLSPKASRMDNSIDLENLYLSPKASLMDNSIDLENLSPDNAFKDNGHNRIHEHASTPSRKRKGDDPGTFSMRLRSRKVQEIVLLDGDARQSESADKTTNKRDAMKIYYPSSEHPQSVELCDDDIKCLEPESLLSSPIMNFYILYLQQPMSSVSTLRGKFHIFNTFFFSKLDALRSKADKASYFLKLRRWWKGIDIFQKAYILLPVHADTHWSLVIICMPAKEDQSGPIILHLDSLKFHKSKSIFNAVERFLKEEWIYLNENDSLAECPIHEMVWKKLPRKIEKKPIAVPQQENEYDCGLFVLYYMQRFIEGAPERLHKKDLNMFGKGWFQPEEASALRKKMQMVLLQLFEDAKSNNKTPEHQTTCQSHVEAESKAIEPTMSEHPMEGSSTKLASPSHLEGSSTKLASPNHLEGSSIQPTSFEHPLECS
ncbi:unnamed protein product [Alopecurus aequalis]